MLGLVDENLEIVSADEVPTNPKLIKEMEGWIYND